LRSWSAKPLLGRQGTFCWPALLGRVGARIEEDKFVQVSLQVDFLEGNREVEAADALVVFRSVAEFDVDPIALVLDDRFFEEWQIRAAAFDRGADTNPIRADRSVDSPLDRALGSVCHRPHRSQPQAE
jgi:hypothetical protein